MATFEFHPLSLDLVKTGQNFVKLHGAKKLLWKRFGEGVVAPVRDVQLNAETVPGVRALVEKMLRHLRWRYTIFGITMPSEAKLCTAFLGQLGEYEAEQLKILTDSIVLTRLSTWHGLNAPEPTLARAVYADFVVGFEVACYLVESSVGLEAEDIEYISRHENTEREVA
ncbi:MAG: hypothetical protein ABW088_00155 [Sedimenticola sp.]